MNFIQCFRANSIYDPNYTALTGVSASSFARFDANYQRYCVLGSKMKVRYIPEGPSYQIVPMVILSKLDTNTSNVAEPNDPWPKWSMDRQVKYMRIFRSEVGSYGGYMKHNFSMKKFFGVKTDDEVDFSSVGSSPKEPALFYLYYGREDGRAGSVSQFNLEVTIDYFVKWKKREDTTVAYTDYKIVEAPDQMVAAAADEATEMNEEEIEEKMKEEED